MGLNVRTKQAAVPLSKKLESVDEGEILARWFGIERIPCVMNSPFRDDKTPSFSVRMAKNGHIYGHDFATGERFSVPDMVMKAEKVDFATAATMILDGRYGDFTRDASVPLPKPVCVSEIDVVTREFNENDLAFWQSFGITKPWLEFGHVYAVSGIVFRTDGYVKDMKADEYAYAYVTFFKGRRHIKVYQPFSKSRKWMNDGDGITQVWNLMDRLPEIGKAVIITSSLKDALCLWANTGIPSCCPQSESANLDETIVEDLKRRFRRVLVLFDNDFGKPRNPGQEGAKKACETFGLENIVIDAWWGCKDPSDLYRKHGREILFRIMKNHNLCTETTTKK